VLRRLPKFLLILALTSSIGLHWAFLQSLAWVSMLAGNLQRTAFTQAVQRTFDGKHPCSLCKAIDQSKKCERKGEFPFQVKKLEFLGQPQLSLPSVPTRFSLLTAGDSFAAQQPQVPPVPPPRSSFI
jgi:hypothetical protein